MNVKKTKKFKENRPENYHVHDSRLVDSQTTSRLSAPQGERGFRLSSSGPVEFAEGRLLPSVV